MKHHDIQQEAWAPFAEGNNDVFKNPILQQIALFIGTRKIHD